MLNKQRSRRGFIIFWLMILAFTHACSSPTPQVIEVTRVVPEVVIVTQIVTVEITLEPTLTPVPTETPTPTPTTAPWERYSVYTPLEDCPPSILEKGMFVYVNYGGGKSSIRSFPDAAPAGNIIGYAIPGEIVRVVGGPVCNYSRLMWQVETTYGLIGWTPESDGENWWLIPSDESFSNP